MADTIDKRSSDVEMMLAHLPEDLDARFAGVDSKLAAIRETLALHTTRYTKIETRLNDLARSVDTRFNDLDRKVDKIEAKLDEVLQRLPKP